MKKLLLIVNPNAGKTQIRTKMMDVLDICTKAGYWNEVYITQKPGEATTVAKTVGANYDRVICIGGDGTLDETLNGLMQLPPKKRPELGYISAGTTNDFANGLQLPMDITEAAAVAVRGEPFAIDVGKLNDSFFSYTIGFGAFTDVSYATSQDLKKVLGQQAYLMEGAKQIMNLKVYHMKIEADGKKYEGDYLLGIVSNSVRVAGMIGIWGENIEMDDGLFELNLLHQPNTLVGWGDLLTAFFITHEESEYITRLKAKKITFHSDTPVDWVQDGEFGGSFTDVQVKVLPHAIRLIRKPASAT